MDNTVIAPTGWFFQLFLNVCTYTHTVFLYLNSLRKLDCVLFVLWVKYKPMLLAEIWLSSSQKLGEMSQHMQIIQQVCLQEIGKGFDFWESFKHLHVSHWDPKSPLFLWKTLVVCLVLLQMCVLSTLSSYFLRLDMKYGSVLWQALSNVVRISHHATNTF